MLLYLRYSELAFQIAEQIKAFGESLKVSIEVVVGGIGNLRKALHSAINDGV